MRGRTGYVVRVGISGRGLFRGSVSRSLAEPLRWLDGIEALRAVASCVSICSWLSFFCDFPLLTLNQDLRWAS